MKRLLLIVCILAGVIGISALMIHDNGMSKAKDTAVKYVPESAKFIAGEEDGKYYELIFHDDKTSEGFEVNVNKETGEVKKIESHLDRDEGSKTVKITEQQAIQIVKERFEGIKSINGNLQVDNGLYEYEVSFKGDDFYGEADVHAESGSVLDSVIKFGTASTIPVNDSVDEGLISYDQAKKLVIEKAGGGTVRDIDLDKEGQQHFYEVELHKDNKEYDYIVNAETKEVVLESEHDCYFGGHHDEERESVVSESEIITENEVMQLVWKKIPKAEIVELSLEEDDGRYEYEGTAILDGYEYEFEINANSGVIINWEKERID